MKQQQQRRCEAGVRSGLHSDDVGAATVLALVAVAVLLAVASAVVTALGGLLAAARARSAADLAALGGAERLRWGDDACAVAARLARANGAVLVSCRVTGAECTVTVSARAPVLARFGRRVTATARAGPHLAATNAPDPRPGARGPPFGHRFGARG